MDRDLRSETVRLGSRRHDQAARLAAESDRGDLFDPGERDDHQRPEQKQAEAERERRARHEIMSVPIREDRRHPGADRVHRACEQQRLGNARPAQRQQR